MDYRERFMINSVRISISNNFISQLRDFDANCLGIV